MTALPLALGSSAALDAPTSSAASAASAASAGSAGSAPAKPSASSAAGPSVREPPPSFGDYAFIPGPWRAKAGTPPADGVPTSYYTAVRFTCHPRIIDDPEAEAELLRRQLVHFQREDHAPVAVDQPPYGRMRPGIRGLRLEVTDVRAKFRYDDHKPVEQRAGVAARLTERGQGLDVPAAHLQPRRLNRTGPWKP